VSTGTSSSPRTAAEAAEALRAAAAQGARVRIAGHGTKLRWGRPALPPEVELLTDSLAAVLEHNEGDFTAVVGPGLPLAALQDQLAEAGQMLAVDPPLGPTGREGADDGATIGGAVACADSGPLRHRFKAARDLVIGVQVALTDGSVARAGGKVIKNVAGYDLAKLFTGSFGTLGMMTELSLRLHPRAARTATAIAEGNDPRALATAADAVAHRPFEPDCLDVRWGGDRGAVLARFGGDTAGDQAARVLAVLREAGLQARVEEDDDALWAAQRAGQRSERGTVVRVAHTQDRLADVLTGARSAGAGAVGRAGLGLSWLRLEDAEPGAAIAFVQDVRTRLGPAPCVVLDAPEEVRRALDPWGGPDGGTLELMRRVKARFDPTGACNPGVYVGGI